MFLLISLFIVSLAFQVQVLKSCMEVILSDEGGQTGNPKKDNSVVLDAWQPALKAFLKARNRSFVSHSQFWAGHVYKGPENSQSKEIHMAAAECLEDFLLYDQLDVTNLAGRSGSSDRW